MHNTGIIPTVAGHQHEHHTFMVPKYQTFYLSNLSSSGKLSQCLTKVSFHLIIQRKAPWPALSRTFAAGCPLFRLLVKSHSQLMAR